MQTARDVVLSKADAFAKANQRVSLHTRPQWATGYVVFDVKDAVPTSSPVEAFAVLAKDTKINFFSVGSNGTDKLNMGLGAGDFVATQDLVSIETPYKLDPKTYMAVEKIGFLAGKPICKYAAVATNVADPGVTTLFTGGVAGDAPFEIHDPGGVVNPAELTLGATTLHNALFEAMRPATTVEMLRGAGNNGGGMMLGTLSMFGGNAVQPYLMADGLTADVGYTVEEGFVWDQENEREGKMCFRLTTRRAVYLPFNLAGVVRGSSTKVAPTKICLPITCIVSGLQLVVGDLLNA